MNRWKDSLNLISVEVYPPEKHMRCAIFWLGAAIDNASNDRLRQSDLALAGAHIRAARKGLGEATQRRQDFVPPFGDLLTIAMRHVTVALDCGEEGGAYWLRDAEACLRTMWKQAQS